MKYSEDIKGLSYFKAHASELINDIYENHKTMIITQNGEAKVVVQDIREYEKNEETIALAKLLNQRKQSLKDGNFQSWESAYKELHEEILKYGK